MALLAQTCNAIGKEPNNHKSSIQCKFGAGILSPKVSANLFRKTSLVASSVSNLTSQSTSPVLSDGKSETSKSEKSPFTTSLPTCTSFSGSMKAQERLAIERRRSHAGDSRKRKSVSVNTAAIERKMSKPEPFYSNRKTSVSGLRKSSRFSQTPSSFPSMPLTSPEALRSTDKPSSPLQHFAASFDPYCLGCRTPHTAGSACIDSLNSLPLHLYPLGTTGSNYSLYAQMLMAASSSGAKAVTPYVCNWVCAESGSCGKRFSSPEELTDHLKTHVLTTPNKANVSFIDNNLEKLAAAPYAATFLSQQAASAGNIGLNVLSKSHSTLNGYSTFKPLQVTSLPSMPIAAGVGPYCSPFPFYGQKLGDAGFYI